jgi:hypothetical protein
MPPIAARLADTAACPCRNNITYMVISPSVISLRTALTAIHA